jgi:mRNA interferase MazF
MAEILRGDIWRADLNPTVGGEQAGVRPVLVISNDIFNHYSQTVIALVLTSKPQSPGFPLTYELKTTCLPKTTWVKIGQIRTLSVHRLKDRIDHILPEEMDTIIEGLDEIVG